MKNFFKKLQKISNNNNAIEQRRKQRNRRTLNRSTDSQTPIFMTPDRRPSGSTGRRHREQAHRIRSESVNRGHGGPGLSPQPNSARSEPKEKSINDVTIERNNQRLNILMAKKDLYRSFIDSYDLPSKISSRMLRIGPKYRLKNLRDFQYSLGIPKTVIYEKTHICVNGWKMQLKRLEHPKGFAMFKAHNEKHKFMLQVPPKPFTICQETTQCDGDHNPQQACPYDKRLLVLGLFTSCDIKSTETYVVNYQTRKRLLKFEAEFEDNYRKRAGMFKNENFNKPIVHKFDRENIKILNIYDRSKFGVKRILNRVDVIKRELVSSREVDPANFKLSEKLEEIHQLPSSYRQSPYFFLKFVQGASTTAQLIFYDFVRDERKVIGELTLAQNLRYGNKHHYGIFDLSHLSKEKVDQLWKFVLAYKDIAKSNRDLGELELKDVLVVIDLEFRYSGGDSENFLCFVKKGDFELFWLGVDGSVFFDKQFDSLMLAFAN